MTLNLREPVPFVAAGDEVETLLGTLDRNRRDVRVEVRRSRPRAQPTGSTDGLRGAP